MDGKSRKLEMTWEMILAADLAAVEYPGGNLQSLSKDLSFNGKFF